MLNLKEKIIFFQSYLEVEENYADTFKADLTMFFDDDFSLESSHLQFLGTLNSKQEIEIWVDKLTSRFVMKFDSELESEDDFIFDYLENG